MKGKNIFLFVLVIVCLRFFSFRLISESILNYLEFCFLFILVLLSIPHFFKKQEGFVFPIQLLVVAIIVSVFMAHYSWGQSIRHGLIITIPLLTWIIFFYLLHLKIPINSIENITLFFGSLYVVLYFFQYFHPGTFYFGKSIMGGDEFEVERGVTRIVFPGAGIFVLATLISINKLTTQKKHRAVWLFFTFFGLLIPFLQVTRMFIAGIFFLYFYHFVKWQRGYISYIGVLLSVFAILFLFLSENPVAKGLIESGQSDANLGKEYIRVQAIDYFLFRFSPSLVNNIFGNGVPYADVSRYGKFVTSIYETAGYFFEDVGIVSVYAMFGVFAVFAYILIWVKSVTLSLPKEYQYCKYYLWYLLFTSFTTFSVYFTHYLISTVFVLYIFQNQYIRRKQVVNNVYT